MALPNTYIIYGELVLKSIDLLNLILDQTKKLIFYSEFLIEINLACLKVQ